MTQTNSTPPSRVPIREGLLTLPLSQLDAVRLVGSRCGDCGETALGRHSNCPNCGKSHLTQVSFSPRGTLWTYTVVRHRPPGDYKGPDPFVPFGLGLVELAEGLRVLAPIEADPSTLRIGMALQFHAFVRPGSSAPEVVTFSFVPAHSEAAHV